MTHPASLSSSRIAAQVRDQVSRAREALSAKPSTPAPGAESTEHRDFVRHYLRFLSVQAVGKFEQAIGKLARGLDILAKRTAATQTRLARTEQDVLALAAALEQVRDAPLEARALAERIARLEAQLTARGRDGADAEFIDAAARHLRGVCLEIDARKAAALGPVSQEWMATLTGLGLQARCVHVEPGNSALPASGRLSPEPCDLLLADVPAASLDVVTALGVLDRLSPLAARAALESCRRALRPGGVIVVLLDATPAHSRPAFLERLDDRLNDAASLAALLQRTGFDRIVDRPLHAAWPAWRVMTARSV